MKLLYTLAFIALCQGAFASKAVTSKMTVTLSDGTTRTVSLRGDEHFSFFASSKGELVIREKDNTWRLATSLEQTEARARLAEAEASRAGLRKAGSIIADNPFPSTGNPKALVILVSFSDRDFEYPADSIKALFNSEDTNGETGMKSYGSLAGFMDFCSGGQFRPEFDFAGPYQLDGTVEYYGQNANGSDSNYSQFIKDSCAAADGDVDFSRYDADGDGYVDLVYIVYAGFGENWGENPDWCLWPKSGTGSYGTYDGVKVNRYGINQELAASDDRTDDEGNHYLNGIGVLAHEFCHTMGLFDVYPTESWDDVTWYDNQSMEIWSLMDYGENNYNGYYPTPLNAWERELFGWIDIDTLVYTSDVTLTPLMDGGKAYRIMNDDNEDEYYVLESIPSGEGTGWYRRMRGNGMVVIHVDYDKNYFSNFSNPNNEHGHPRLTILPADGLLMTSYRTTLDEDDENYITSQEYYADHAGDPYPGTGEITGLTDYKAYTGTVNKPLTDITQDGWEISFRFTGLDMPEEGSTGVSLPGAAESSGNAPEYNPQGQRTGGAYRGVVVREGRKYIRR